MHRRGTCSLPSPYTRVRTHTAGYETFGLGQISERVLPEQLEYQFNAVKAKSGGRLGGGTLGGSAGVGGSAGAIDVAKGGSAGSLGAGLAVRPGLRRMRARAPASPRWRPNSRFGGGKDPLGRAPLQKATNTGGDGSGTSNADGGAATGAAATATAGAGTGGAVTGTGGSGSGSGTSYSGTASASGGSMARRPTPPATVEKMGWRPMAVLPLKPYNGSATVAAARVGAVVKGGAGGVGHGGTGDVGNGGTGGVGGAGGSIASTRATSTFATA